MDWKRILYPPMIWGAVLGWGILATIDHGLETLHHKGPGIVLVGPDEREEWVSESQYKRQHYCGCVMFLGFGLFLWKGVAESYAPDPNALERLKQKMTRY